MMTNLSRIDYNVSIMDDDGFCLSLTITADDGVIDDSLTDDDKFVYH